LKISPFPLPHPKRPGPQLITNFVGLKDHNQTPPANWDNEPAKQSTADCRSELLQQKWLINTN